MKDQASGRVLLQGILENGLYKVSSSVNTSPSLAVSSSLTSLSVLATQPSFNHAQAFITQHNNTILWHNRLGHPASNVITQVMRSCNLNFSNFFDLCSSCQLAKSHGLPFVISKSKAMKPFDSVHSDL